MTDIYEQHRKSFPREEAFVIMKQAERVANVAFKFPKDGAGRLYCYLHVISIPMVRGWASGYGYCKTDAAFRSAASRIDRKPRGYTGELVLGSALTQHFALIDPFMEYPDAGHSWRHYLEERGYSVWQAL